MVRGCGVFICNLLFYKLVFYFCYVYVNICVGKDWKEDCEYKLNRGKKYKMGKKILNINKMGK